MQSDEVQCSRPVKIMSGKFDREVSVPTKENYHDRTYVLQIENLGRTFSKVTGLDICRCPVHNLVSILHCMVLTTLD